MRALPQGVNFCRIFALAECQEHQTEVTAQLPRVDVSHQTKLYGIGKTLHMEHGIDAWQTKTSYFSSVSSHGPLKSPKVFFANSTY